ncbi:MAG TPA: glycosyltransferase [Lacipirellulaceae bacterium]|nr:glycosyltransferase [Lacipirellulaceae bacterium]
MLSFIVPAHNEEALVGRTLEGICQAAEAIGQTFEVILVDDASTDRTAAIARERGATVVQVNHRQIAATRNAGARTACGERFFFVDADTVVDERVLGAALRALDAGAAGGGAPPRLDGPLPIYARLLVPWFGILMRIAGVSGGAFLFCKRTAFEAVGGFDERLYGAEDAALSAALRREGRFVILWPRVLTSGRRVRTMSGLKMLGFFVQTAVTPSKTLMNRSHVENMWYDSNRANDGRLGGSLLFHASNAAALLILLAVVTGPLWSIPLPEALRGGWLDTAKYGVQVFLVHVGLMLLPCAYLLFRALVQQKLWSERLKLAALFAVCLWLGWDNARNVYGFWSDLL